jgi:hypothetical protein
MKPTVNDPPLPPFCTMGPDWLPHGPPPGTPESMALAAWEVLTRARVARSAGSGRMSLLGRYRAEGGELNRDRMIWIALHAFEGAEERWACRLAGARPLTDRELDAAVIQEMGGPAEEPDEMTTLGFWLGDIGFSFDSRGPSIEVLECRPGTSRTGGVRRRRIGSGTIAAAARRLLSITAGVNPSSSPSSTEMQLSLL